MKADVLGFYHPDCKAFREKQIRAYAARNKFSAPDFSSPLFHETLAQAAGARGQKTRKNPVLVLGYLQDISFNLMQKDGKWLKAEPLPEKTEENFNAVLREAVIGWALAHGITLLFLDDARYRDEPTEHERNVAGVCRNYRNCLELLDQSAQKHHRVVRVEKGNRGSMLTGRPPFGYDSIKGKLSVNTYQAAAVRYISRQSDAGLRVQYIIDGLRQEFPTKEPNGKGGRMGWTRTKLARIMSRMDLYRHGKYESTKLGVTMTCPELIILRNGNKSHVGKG